MLLPYNTNIVPAFGEIARHPRPARVCEFQQLDQAPVSPLGLSRSVELLGSIDAPLRLCL